MPKKTLIIAVLTLSIMGIIYSCSVSKEPVDYVDPFIGTSGSRWMMYPGASTPFGMVKLSPDNQGQVWKAGYEYSIGNIAGFSHLHSWTMGGLLTMPTTGPLSIHPGSPDSPSIGWTSGYRSRFKHSEEHASPGYYSVRLYDYDINAELTATTRCGFQRYTFPQAEDARILFDLQFPTEYGFHVLDAKIRKVNNTEIEGYSKQRSTDWNEYTVYFVAQLNKPFRSFDGWVGNDVQTGINEFVGKGDMGAILNYQTSQGDTILLKTGISLVSIDQARLNLQTELGLFGWDFDAVREKARETWNTLLSKIEVTGGTEQDRVKFYTNMYRAYAARTTWSDVNGKYVDMNEKVQQLSDPDSPVYGCDAFWNTFWNLNQLWTLVTPEIANKWVRSLLEIYKKGGWLSKGPTGIEYSSIMVASHEIPLMVSAYQKGIRNYDVEEMYQAVKHNQMEQGRAYPGGGYVGNHQLQPYMKLGYVPVEEGPVSNTLEYAYDDWSVAQLAKALGHKQDYSYFLKRVSNYKNVFDPEVGYVREKHADGSWVEDFNPYSGKGFVEGNSWQYTFFAPHDVHGMMNLIGKDEFNKRLNDGFEKSSKSKWPFFALRDRMAEFPINHGNQPNMEAAYLFNYSGKPWLTQKWARAIMERYYGADPYNGWPGDEDQGQMGAWFVMSAMGLFEMRGGAAIKPVYEIGSPLFKKVTIHLDPAYYSDNTFVIEAKNNSKQNVYIQSATLNGKSLTTPWFYHQDLIQGGKLVLKMGAKPNKEWGSKPADAPPSMSDGK